MENIRKKQEGITLIALVVTIVVLLILAGTSIAMLTGDNGIITNAQKSQMENTKSEVIEKMNMAYNAAYSEARIKMATDPGYQPSAHIAELAGIVAKELGVTEETTDVPTTGINNEYHVYYKADGTIITMLYGDNKFSLKADAEAENNLYPNIKGEITLSTTQITYTKQPDGTVNNQISNITIESGTGKNVGDIVSIKSTEGTTEEFYILSYDNETKKAVALTKYNLKVGTIYITSGSRRTILDTEEEYGLQNSEMIGYPSDGNYPMKGTISFSNSGYWDSTYLPFGNSSYPYVYDSNSNLYQYVENYKTKLGNSVNEVRLAAYEEIKSIWDNKENYPWIYATSYWLGSYGLSVWNVSANGYLSPYGKASGCNDDRYYGVRPVIEFILQ